MRKTRTCVARKVERILNVFHSRTCQLSRGHPGKHYDERGAWE